MIVRALVPMLALAAALPAPAAAQPSGSDPLALQALRNYAICAVGRTPQGAVQVLAMDPGDSGYERALRRYARGHDSCARPGDRLEFGGLLFAGGLAEALIARFYRGRTPAAAAEVSPPVAAVSSLQAIGRCVARSEPQAVTQLLATEPGTAAELAALQLTGETLPRCVPEGVTITLNKPAVRAIYALGAYHLLAEQQAAASAEDSQ